MKRSDFIPDEELKRLIQLAEDAPGGITLLAKTAYGCNKEAISNIEREIEILKAETEADVFDHDAMDGKPKFSSIKARTDEVNRRLLNNQKHQNMLTEKSRLEIERQQKFSQWYEAKDVFKAVLKKLGVVKALQETENLTMKFKLKEREPVYVKAKD